MDSYEHIKIDACNGKLSLFSEQTIHKLSSFLDSRKVLLAETGLHRDWKGLAEFADIDASVIRAGKMSPTEHCIHLWIKKNGLIAEFWEALEKMDRYDVISDTLNYIYDDFKANKVIQNFPMDNIHSSIAEYDSKILTKDDIVNIDKGEALQLYDAFVLFADEDNDFVKLLIEKLEGKYRLKLFLKDRDLLAGLTFESIALMKMIEERCARVIVILSTAFLKSNANQFLTRFAHSYGIEKHQRILIPCTIEHCTKPPELSYFHSLDYTRSVGCWDFWEKLAASVTYRSTSTSQFRKEKETNFEKSNDIENSELINSRGPKETNNLFKRKKEASISKSETETVPTLPLAPTTDLDSGLESASSDVGWTSRSQGTTATLISAPITTDTGTSSLIEHLNKLKNRFKIHKKKRNKVNS